MLLVYSHVDLSRGWADILRVTSHWIVELVLQKEQFHFEYLIATDHQLQTAQL